jgi:hypothetical protein
MRRFALPILIVLTFAGCSGDENKDVILPLQARFDVAAVGGDPVIFFQKSPTDTNLTDDVVVVDVMLRSSASITFDAIDMEILFDPSLLQVGQVDMTTTPLGPCPANLASSCSSNGPTDPLCCSNANAANSSGDLIIGVSRTGGSGATVTGTDKLMTLRFIGATVGTSMVRFETTLPSGDCEILTGVPPAPLVNLGVPCDSDNATVTVAR